MSALMLSDTYNAALVSVVRFYAGLEQRFCRPLTKVAAIRALVFTEQSTCELVLKIHVPKPVNKLHGGIATNYRVLIERRTKLVNA